MVFLLLLFLLQCHRPHAIRAFFKQVPYSEPRRIALIGAGCSVASEATAEISHNFNLIQVISYLYRYTSGLKWLSLRLMRVHLVVN